MILCIPVRAESLLVPIVKIPRVTSRTLEATWGVIDVPVDSWTVSIREVPGEGNEPLPPFQVRLKTGFHSQTILA